MEPNSPKKIQFAVPLFQSQIDPEAAEQGPILSNIPALTQLQCSPKIRKRRPTPASLVIMTDSPTEIDEKRMNNNSQEENATPKQRKQSVYTPPAMKGVKHLKNQNDSAFPEEEEGINERDEEWSP